MNVFYPNGNTVNVRIFHASVNAPTVDVYVNDKLIARGLKYKDATQYLPLEKGQYNIKLYATNTNKLLLNQDLMITDNKYITIAAAKDNGGVTLLVYEDLVMSPMMPQMPPSMSMYDDMEMPTSIPKPNQQFIDYTNEFRSPLFYREDYEEVEEKLEQANVRFIHLSPNAPSVDITLPDGTVLFDNVMYKEATDYIEVDPGTYTLQVRQAGTNKVVLTVPNVTLRPNDVKTIYAVGLVGGSPSLEALILNDGV